MEDDKKRKSLGDEESSTESISIKKFKVNELDTKALTKVN